MQLVIVGATASVRWRRARSAAVRWLATCLVALSVLAASGKASACTLPADPSLFDALLSIEGRLPALPELAASDAARALLQRPLHRGEAQSVGLESAAGEVYGVPWPADAVDGATSDVAEGDLAAGDLAAGDVAPATAAVADWAQAASRSVSAYGVFVHDRSLGAIVAAGTYWTSPLLDRLEVTRLSAPWPGSMPNARLLAASGSCQVEVRTWLELPIELVEEMTALDADAGADGDAYVYLVATVPSGEPARRWIGLDELVDAVTFAHPATRDAVSFHAWFGGPRVDPVTLARALPRVRSNLGPRALWGLVQDLR